LEEAGDRDLKRMLAQNLAKELDLATWVLL
jgi:hypothetical protein